MKGVRLDTKIDKVVWQSSLIFNPGAALRYRKERYIYERGAEGNCTYELRTRDKDQDNG